ncbi:MAG: bifunctional DNA-formamidopyrimidine glycosylase/DNA-(apurinic or apyrimidinic site) lyase [Actinobacteria bacterium]|nr:bifunctional DNA-formamidopyrimidine glycosylase/DNA-(apurinic or apyrimidinic site) lyase [Actinomycetota bacterium]MSX37953.1 bifunctional DNA-formamidopyrimidine glycosylase/DNA-(apurinic or apyrimidinic site) lyase [Actinomycetota bacterium]
MPELPEVEVVRRGLEKWVTGRTIASAEILHPRAARRHEAGPDDLVASLRGRSVVATSRRGKYLWLRLDGGDIALVAHLGMSGQLLVQPSESPVETHLRARIGFADGGRELRFVDQRTFGSLAVDPLVDDGSGGLVPTSVVHIGRDPLDPAFDDADWIHRLQRRATGIKRALLDQTLASGVGNIYADESLWRARLHWATPTDRLTAARARHLLAQVREVMTEALAQGGTSFDALYVNVNGESGYFDVSLAAYGREGRPCPRCGRSIVREAFTNRSSFRCPACQPAPRGHRVASTGRAR